MPPAPVEAPDGGWSWLVVVGISITNLSILPIIQCFGLLFEDKFRELGFTTAETSFLLHLNSSITCSLGLVSAPLLRRFSFRQVALIGCVIASLGICLTSTADSMASFVITYCILLGFGQGVLYPATTQALSSHFKQRRSMAMGFTITATGLGPIVTPHIIALLLDYYGTSGTVLLLGGGALHSVLGATLLRPLQQPQKLTLTQNEEGKCDSNSKSSNVHENVQSNASSPLLCTKVIIAEEDTTTKLSQFPGKPWIAAIKRPFIYIAQALDLGLLKDPVYLSIVAGMSLSFVAELNFNMLTPFILADLIGLSRASVATVMSVQAAADILARLLVPLAADTWQWSARTLYVLSLLSSILGRSVLAYFHSSLSVVLTLAVLLGIAKGVKAVFQALIIPNYVPLEKLPAANGLLMVFNGILSISLGPVIGFVRDVSSSHIPALHVTSGMSLLCVLLWTVEALIHHQHTGHSKLCLSKEP